LGAPGGSPGSRPAKSIDEDTQLFWWESIGT